MLEHLRTLSLELARHVVQRQPSIDKFRARRAHVRNDSLLADMVKDKCSGNAVKHLLDHCPHYVLHYKVSRVCSTPNTNQLTGLSHHRFKVVHHTWILAHHVPGAIEENI